MEQNNSYPVQSVDRALLLLALLRDRGRISVTEAAQAIEVAPSTAHRLLNTLVNRGWATQPSGRLYQPGPQFFSSLSQGATVASLRRRLYPYLVSLHEKVQETVHLMLLEGAHVHFIDGMEASKPLRVGSRVGARLPAYLTSGGKAMLAELDSDDLHSLFDFDTASEPKQRTLNFAELEGELDEVRRRGFGINHGESEDGIAAIGATLGTLSNEPMAALVVAIPTPRYTVLQAERVTASLLRVCTESRSALLRGVAHK